MYEYLNCYLELRMCLAIGVSDYMLLLCEPHTGIAMLKVLILCQIWRLQLGMKAVAVLINFIDKAEIFLEAGRMNVVDLSMQCMRK